MSVEWITLLAFVPAALALNLTPGADMMFCLGQGLRSGPRAAMAANAGISAGAMVHVVLAGLGLGAAINSVPWAFDAIRWVGVAYLLWLAWHTVRSAGAVSASEGVGRPPAKAFRDALLVNLTNPKVILFVLAFLPQFIDPTRHVFSQFLILGALLSLGGFLVNGAVGLFAGRIGRYLGKSSGFARGLAWVSGGIFTALALRLVFLERS